MRISTNTIYDAGMNRMNDSQIKMLKVQQQVASGQRMLTPADDPIGAARALNLIQGQEVNNQFAVNRTNAKNTLSQEEAVLEQVTSLLQDVKTAVIQAGNGALNDDQRKYIGLDVQARFDELVGLANTRDGIGNYLFGGYQIGSQPYTEDNNGVRFNGDQGQIKIQVDSGRYMPIGDNGEAIFDNIPSAGIPNAKQSMFATLKDLVSLLQTSTASESGRSTLSEGLKIANENIDSAIDNVLVARSSVGSRLKELDILDHTGDAKNILYAQSLSVIQDLDYNKALTDLSIRQSILEASQKSFTKVSQLSLFALI